MKKIFEKVLRLRKECLPLHLVTPIRETKKLRISYIFFKNPLEKYKKYALKREIINN